MSTAATSSSSTKCVGKTHYSSEGSLVGLPDQKGQENNGNDPPITAQHDFIHKSSNFNNNDNRNGGDDDGGIENENADNVLGKNESLQEIKVPIPGIWKYSKTRQLTFW